jgi:hypothetical protein
VVSVLGAEKGLPIVRQYPGARAYVKGPASASPASARPEPLRTMHVSGVQIIYPASLRLAAYRLARAVRQVRRQHASHAKEVDAALADPEHIAREVCRLLGSPQDYQHALGMVKEVKKATVFTKALTSRFRLFSASSFKKQPPKESWMKITGSGENSVLEIKFNSNSPASVLKSVYMPLQVSSRNEVLPLEDKSLKESLRMWLYDTALINCLIMVHEAAESVLIHRGKLYHPLPAGLMTVVRTGRPIT